MLILIHVIMALAALTVSVLANIKPSVNKLFGSYVLAVNTLLSGTLLIVVNHANVLRTCLTGIIFFAVVAALNEIARKRLTSNQL